MSHPGAVLLIEDNDDDVVLVQRAFRKCQVANPLHVVADGDAATAYLSGVGHYADRERHPLPVLILLDLKLPRKSGLEVLAWMRQHLLLKRIPVVVLTSSNEQPEINRAYDLGANSYLVKPVDFDDLRELIHRVGVYWMTMNMPPDMQTP